MSYRRSPAISDRLRKKETNSMNAELINSYLAGAALVRQAVDDLTDAQLDAHPIACRWSIRQVVCHLADFEPIYADRMKRVVAEERPTFAGGDPGMFAARLSYGHRPLANELKVIESVRRQMAVILFSLSTDDFQRTGMHPRNGALTLATLLQRITDHIPHHLRFIEAKRHALRRSAADLDNQVSHLSPSAK
jgi:uncharacterized damage-inducible protein DinB